MTGELNAYDVLVNDWIVFTDETLPGTGRRHGRHNRRDETDRVTEPIAGADRRRGGADTADDTDDPTPAPTSRRRTRRGGASHEAMPDRVLIRPVVSEKSYALMDGHVYVFVVDRSATKIDVRRAVEQAFNVRVDKVNTLNREGKTRSTAAQHRGHRPDTKRAIVTLHQGDSIDLFES